MEHISRQIYSQILKANKILLVPHQNPDGDALGSVSTLSHFFDEIGKPHSIYCVSSFPEKYINWPHLKPISNDKNLWQDTTHDLIIVVDSGDPRYAGIDEHLKNLPHSPTIINIDHHPTNEHYAHHNLVVPTASSTTEVLYHFFKHNRININKKMAATILIGLITDTENFSNPGTSVSSLSIASDLIYRGANFNFIKDLILKNKTINALKLWGIALSRLNKNEENDIVYTYITQNDLKENNAADSEVEGIANFLNNLGEGKGSLILKELPDGKIKGSFRTTHDDFDVSEIAKSMGGGGHKKAAGFIAEGTIEEVLNKIWNVLQSTKK